MPSFSRYEQGSANYTACRTTIPPTAPALRLQCYMPSTIARTMVQMATVPVPITGLPDIDPPELLRDQRKKV